MDLEFRIFKLLKGWIAMTMKVIKVFATVYQSWEPFRFHGGILIGG